MTAPPPVAAATALEAGAPKGETVAAPAGAGVPDSLSTGDRHVR
jgi:hypothetical protein